MQSSINRANCGPHASRAQLRDAPFSQRLATLREISRAKPVQYDVVEARSGKAGAAYNLASNDLAISISMKEERIRLDYYIRHNKLNVRTITGPYDLSFYLAENICLRESRKIAYAKKRRLLYKDDVACAKRHASGHFRLATYSEVPELAQIARHCFKGDPTLPDEKKIAEHIDGRTAYVWDNLGPKSLANLACSDGKSIEIANVMTRDTARRCHYAWNLVDSMVRKCILDDGLLPTLLVDEDNQAAIPFYLAMGFKDIGSSGFFLIS